MTLEVAMITYERLIEVLEFDPETGFFTWRSSLSNRAMKGRPASSRKSNGYRQVKIDGATYLCHRLALLYVSGEWPDGVVDHIDGDRANNSITNLRVATRSENQRNAGVRKNNTSGHAGVAWCKTRRMWKVSLRTVESRIKHIGFFEDIEAAVTARDGAYKKFGCHANHGTRPSHELEKLMSQPLR